MKPQLLCQKHHITMCLETIWQCSEDSFHFMSYKTSPGHHEDLEQPLQLLKEPAEPEGGPWQRPAVGELSGGVKRE